jgi:uncharacterized protein
LSRAFEQPATLALPAVPGEPSIALEGLFVPVPDARAAAVVAPPHPLMGGSMESPVVGEVAWACQKAEAASLRFNWRGVGASAGVSSADLAQADEDYRAALDFLADSVSVPRVACGYSFGALAAARAAQTAPGIRRMILVAPPTQMLEADALCRFPGEVLLLAGQDDEWVDAGVLGEIARQSVAARVEVIPGCDHFFMSALDEVGRVLARWWDQGSG